MGMKRTITKTIDFGEIGEREVDFNVIYSPGTPPSGMWGPPENYDPGDGSELEIVDASLDGHKILWLFDKDSLELITEEICIELDCEDVDFDEPEMEYAA